MTTRLLVVDDSELWRRHLRSAVTQFPHWLIVDEISNGLDAVRKAAELQPDLILLDVALPLLNGIEAAREIMAVHSTSKILFVTQQTSWDIAEAALSTGARGYVVKSDAARELLPAIEAVIAGERFIGARFGGRMVEPSAPPARIHEVAFHAHPGSIVDRYARFAAARLKAGHGFVLVATDEHRNGVYERLQADAIDVDRGIKDGWYQTLDMEGMLSSILVDGWPDEERFWKAATALVIASAKASRSPSPRVALCGECAPHLLARGRLDAAIRLEQLCNELTRTCEIDVLCGYSSSGSRWEELSPAVQKICAEHSAVHWPSS